MDITVIEDSEVLYRAVTNSGPDGFISGRPSAAVFLSQNGTSVERDGGRPEEQIVNDLKTRFKNYGYTATVKITAGSCRNIGAYPNPVGNRKNQFHAEIWESKNERLLSFIKAMQLAQLCEVVNDY